MNGSGATGQSGAAGGAQGGGTQGAQGGQGAADWRSMIPPEYAQDPSLANIKDLPSLVKGFISAQSMIGAEKIALPAGKNDTPEYWNQVFDKLGRPKSPDGYTFERPRIPEGMAYNEELEKSFKKVCHELGILPRQAQGLYKFYNDLAVQEFQNAAGAMDRAYADGEKKIREIFGDKADEAVQLANRVFKTFGGSPEEVAALSQRCGNDPLVVAMLARIGQNMREDALVRGEKADFELTGKDAEAKKRDILYNKDNPLNAAYLDKKHPRHQEALDTVMRLNEIILGAR